MGVWGSGLYSGDFALDLRASVRAVARLPFSGDELLDLLCGLEASTANNPEDEEHSTFWLVVADQFAKRGIESRRTREKALHIIESGSDLAMLTKLGMDAAGLRKRQQMLAELQRSLAAPNPPARPRAVLKKPQPFIMEVGDALIYPTTRGHCINPYFKSKEVMIPAWQQDGWSGLVIVARGRAFGFLAWYRALTATAIVEEKPDLVRLRSLPIWALRPPGTCSAVHFRRMELEKVGAVPVDTSKLQRAFPGMAPGIYAAVSDISICNHLEAGPAILPYHMPRPGEPPSPTPPRRMPGIMHLDEILS